MAQKVSVKVPLTAQQKEKIRRATGRTISALKVESTGAATLKGAIPRLSRVATAKVNLGSAMRVRLARTPKTAKIVAARIVAAKNVLAKGVIS